MNITAPPEIPRRSSNVPMTLLLFALLFIAAWLPRFAQLDAFVTPDERRWLQRSANFFYALDQHDYISTYQAGHPGVTVMWAGTAGFLTTFPTYPQQVTRPLDEEDFDAWMRAQGTPTLLDLLVAGRRWIVLIISLIIAATYLPLSSMLGSVTAFIAMLFVAWQPFHIALSRQLHPDGLLAALTIFALAAFSAWLYGHQRFIYLLLAGMATGLAILTKSPALVVPFVMFLLLFEAWLIAWHSPPRRKMLWRGGLQLVVYSVITFIACWPITWTLPQEALMRMLNLALEYSQQGHELPLFFMGKTIEDPGALFYPVSLLMRATPATLFGVVGAWLALWYGWGPMRASKTKLTLTTLLMFVVVYLVAITLSQKKMDRYLLPIMPVLAVIAAVGWASVATAIGQALRRAWKRTNIARVSEFAMVGVVLLLLHGSFSVANAPYYLTYYNPLIGGSRTASQVMMIGWGEGLDAAAHWINQQPLTMHRVVAWYGEGPLSYYLNPTIEVLPFYADGDTTDEYWFNADYAVLYINQWQRANPSRDIIDYFTAQTPAHTVNFAGLDLVRIYALRDMPPPEVTSLHRMSTTRWQDEIELAGYYLENETVFPDEDVPFALYWRASNTIAQDYTLELTLTNATGSALWQTTRSPAGIETSDWPVGKLWRDAYTLEIPAQIAPGNYALVARLHTPEGELLPVTQRPAAAGEARMKILAPGMEDEGMVVARLNVQQPTIIRSADAVWQAAKIDAIAAYANKVTPGTAFLVDVNVTMNEGNPRKLSLRVLNDAGERIAQNDQVLQSDMRFRLLIPEDARPGRYTLAAVLYEPDTLAALPDQQGAFSVDLAKIEVR